MGLIWWEKTVEYAFVMHCAPRSSVAFPLDGKQEAAGDTILKLFSKWIIIEFKRDRSTVNSEAAKLTSPAAAFAELAKSGGHHLIVYGAVSNGEFVLEARTYFEGKACPIDAIGGRGATIDHFRNYLKSFTAYKKALAKNAKTGAVGSIGMEEMSMVAGVGPNGGKPSLVMPLQEFVNLIDAQGQTQTQTHGASQDRGYVTTESHQEEGGDGAEFDSADPPEPFERPTYTGS